MNLQSEKRLGCVLLAAGGSRRFGQNKLLLEYGGLPLYKRAMDCIPGVCKTVVVAAPGPVAAEAVRRGFLLVENCQPELGQSLSLRLGLGELLGMPAVMFMVADQPCLSLASVERLVELHLAQPQRIVALAHGGRRGNPAIFPQAFFAELMQLSGDVGGSRVMRRHEGELALCQAPAAELMDVDTLQEFERLKEGDLTCRECKY